MQKYKDFQPTEFDSKGLLGEYYGIADFLVLPVGQNRDSSPMDQSNFATALNMLSGESEDVQVHRFGHWSCGWFEIILVNPLNPDKLKIAEEIQDKLDDYPVLNEHNLSAREWNAIDQYWDTLTLRDKLDYIHDTGECIFAARATDLSDFSERAPRAAQRIEDSRRE